ncbi:MAG: hypothetical protein RIC51_06535 [Erythrobacter sp.]
MPSNVDHRNNSLYVLKRLRSDPYSFEFSGELDGQSASQLVSFAPYSVEEVAAGVS